MVAVASRAGVATGHGLPPLPVQGRPVRRGLPGRLPARGRRRGAAGRAGEPAQERLVAAVETFARRALRGPAAGLGAARRAGRPRRRGRAPAVPPRLRRRLSPRSPTRASRDGELPPQDLAFTAAALVGAIGEALVGPPPHPADTDVDALVAHAHRASACVHHRSELLKMSTVARPEAETYATHEVCNQVPPLEGRDLFSTTPPLVEGLEREGGGWARERAVEAGAFWGGEPQEWGRAGQREPAGAAHARPLRQPHRRGRVPPRLAPADGARRRARAARAAVDEPPARARTSRARRST